jgi:hypothetical protein
MIDDESNVRMKSAAKPVTVLQPDFAAWLVPPLGTPLDTLPVVVLV